MELCAEIYRLQACSRDLVAVGQWLQSHFTVTETRFQGGGGNFQRAQGFKRQGRAAPKSKNLVLEGPHATNTSLSWFIFDASSSTFLKLMSLGT